MLESVDEAREQYNNLQIELHWANVSNCLYKDDSSKLKFFALFCYEIVIFEFR